MNMTSNVASRAVLVGLRVSTWTARKYDRKVSSEVATDKSADQSAGRYNKHLLAGAVEHKVVLEAAQAMRDLHYRETLPWSDEGWRMLPTANYLSYTEKMRAAIARYDEAVDYFLQAYPMLQARAVDKLGDLYSEDDFPSTSVVAAKFARGLDYRPVPAEGDLRVDLPEDQASLIRASIVSHVEAATKDAMADAWDRLREAVQRIQKASGEGGIVRGTLIDNARMVVDTLTRLNFTNDPALEAMRVRVERELTTIAIEDLRADDKLRADTERRASDILKAMSGLFAPAAAA